MVVEERRLLYDAWPEVKTPPISRACHVVFSGLQNGASSSQATATMLVHLASLFYNLPNAPLTFVTVLAGHEDDWQWQRQLLKEEDLATRPR